MNDENSDLRIVAHESLRYVASTADFLCDHSLVGEADPRLSKEFLRSMRTHLSVPSIFATLRVMRRLQQLMIHAAEKYDSGEIAFKPPKAKKGSVNYTMKIIYSNLVKRVYKKVNGSMENTAVDFNPFSNISSSLDQIIHYVAEKQFGITIQ